MSSLNKLAIRGIRSFDDKQIAVIEFFTPVTVIVGHNGSGKTTIIECLKYATTGEQPPNSRGGAFVHDPKMANEKEVKAQVKLRFHAANSQRMLAVRNLSVTVKKGGGLTMKTLESILSLADGADKGGKRATISTKCAEIDAEIPMLLGVSKAVLDNVIFCHQEDSYWPLAEPAALKKKFDEIFEATRYTKALDAIKSLRKDRVAELKADKERLDALAREKSHADKLRGRASDLQSDIAIKEQRHESLRNDCDELIMANKRFYESSLKFREQYVRIESNQKDQNRLQTELNDLLQHVQEVTATDTELQDRIDNSDKYVAQAESKLRLEERRVRDTQDDLYTARKEHMSLKEERGKLEAEKKQHERHMEERDAKIRQISQSFEIEGYESGALDREQILRFIAQLDDLKKRHDNELENIKGTSTLETKRKIDELQSKETGLVTQLEVSKQKRTTLTSQVSSLQESIRRAQDELSDTKTLTREVANIQTLLSEKAERISKIKDDIVKAKYDMRIQELSSKIRAVTDQRDALSLELKNVSLQADQRAKLDINRKDVKAKAAEVQTLTETYNPSFRKLVGKDIQVSSMEVDVDMVLKDKEREVTDLEADYNQANVNVQQIQANISRLKKELKVKREEVKVISEKIRTEVDPEFATVQNAIAEANVEVNHRRTALGSSDGTVKFYNTLLKKARSTKTCAACNRGMDDHEMHVFENYIDDQLKNASPEWQAKHEEEAELWEKEVQRLTALLPLESTRDNYVKHEIPRLEEEIKKQEEALPPATAVQDAAFDALEAAKRELKELSFMKQAASTVSKARKEIAQLEESIKQLEDNLSNTGFVKTADDLQVELDNFANEQRALEREKSSLMNDREQQANLLRTHENEHHQLLLRESDLKSQVHDQEALEKKLTSLHKEVAEASEQLKDIDNTVRTSVTPLDDARNAKRRYQKEADERVHNAERKCQRLARSKDELETANKIVESYIRNKRARLLQECEERIETSEKDIEKNEKALQTAQDTVAALKKEIHENGSIMANLRANQRLRKWRRDLVELQEALKAYDMEELARAHRQFNEKYTIEKKLESDKESEYARLGGELSTLKEQLRVFEKDLNSDFKDINKRYIDQLVKVKMSDMANNDLEKYAKALDNAIMKYHSLKMEEVNDTMRHLWNKTYQGTDIDGIKIRSDVEGGASKRSYNYRVVMTKDQVEMDMRGRCSAGQKMLASIIIRLALSDSFGQNCGILALDEPTNALDVENIDALASSLVDIINERKSHANFQLIIITHDENFLRKLGQANVMEYYWRVSRDARQKSIIERQRVV